MRKVAIKRGPEWRMEKLKQERQKTLEMEAKMKEDALADKK